LEDERSVRKTPSDELKYALSPHPAKAAQSPTRRIVISRRRLGRAGNVTPGRQLWQGCNRVASNANQPVRLSNQVQLSLLRSPWQPSVFLVLRDPVNRIVRVLTWVVGELVLHEESVFAAVFVIGSQDPYGPEALLLEEELGSQIGLTDLQSDARAP